MTHHLFILYIYLLLSGGNFKKKNRVQNINLKIFIIYFIRTIHSTKTFILYFRKSHNTSCLPPKILHNDCIRFLLGHEGDPREKSKTMPMQIFCLGREGGGVKEVYYGICESRELNKAALSTDSEADLSLSETTAGSLLIFDLIAWNDQNFLGSI